MKRRRRRPCPSCPASFRWPLDLYEHLMLAHRVNPVAAVPEWKAGVR